MDREPNLCAPGNEAAAEQARLEYLASRILAGSRDSARRDGQFAGRSYMRTALDALAEPDRSEVKAILQRWKGGRHD